ncbi:SpoVR family protein [bacterium]|nr:SpoVR family protein [bacterium]
MHFPGGYTMSDLEEWNDRIEHIAAEMGLNFFPIDFEICDHDQMLGYITYSGMPAHYPHWSYGKGFERTRTLYDKGLSGLPYEMVINSDPCLAYLMRDNSLTLQILTIAHVYAHDDFFKNNRFFADTRPELTTSDAKARAQRVRAYMEDPSIGPARVERILDAAHALQFNIDRNRLVRRPTRKEQERRVFEESLPREDRFTPIRPHEEYVAPDLQKIPLEPDADLLLFLRDYHTRLHEWEKDLLTIVHEEACYFLPQMETKIMNEGWASFWHHRILNALEMPAGLHMEFLVHHNQVVRAHPGGLNPYHLGFKLFHHIFNAFGGESGGGMEKIFAVREEDRDSSFLRRFLTEELMRDFDMFVHQQMGHRREVTEVSDPDGWKHVRDELLRNVGMGRIPLIRVIDAAMSGDRRLLLRHEFDGRELDLQHAERTLGYVQNLWGAKVVIETNLQEKPVHLTHDGQNFQIEH